jgi:predicted GIY-YIG superfamily endonuclease
MQQTGSAQGVIGDCYMLRFDPPYKHAGRYIGWTQRDVLDRYDDHVTGKGSPLVKAAVQAGCLVTIVRVWRSVDRHFERALKNQKNSQRLDPVANGAKTLLDCIAENH